MRKRLLSTAMMAVVASGLLVAGCGEAESPTTTTTTETTTPTVWKLDAMPRGAVDVVQAKADAKEGDQIAVVGRIGGRSEPITAESGLFVIMDPAIPSCADNPDDKCAKPWDYCCETPETIAKNGATIQLRDAEGNAIALAEGELEPLSRVAVVGTVAPRPNSDTLIVYASGVHVVTEQ